MKKLGFGLMRLPLCDPEDPASVDLAQTEQMVDTFLARGFTYFDTAYMYHNGRSESIAGEVLVRRHPRKAFTLTTKLPMAHLKSKEDMERIFRTQQNRCHVEYFDYYLLHNLNRRHYPIAEELGSFRFALEKKRAGLTRRIGFSYHDDAALLEQILQEHPEVDVVQLQINYLDWESERVQSRRCYEVARRHGKEVIVMEPVKGGALAKVPAPAEKAMREMHPDWSPASWAIRFAAGLAGVKTVLSGMSNLEQLLDNTGYMQECRPLETHEIQLLAHTAEQIREGSVIPCTACNYCMESCPQQIPIPRYFALYNIEKRGGAAQREAYATQAAREAKASACIGCGKCEQQCPQRLAVRALLRNVARVFEQ